MLSRSCLATDTICSTHRYAREHVIAVGYSLAGRCEQTGKQRVTLAVTTQGVVIYNDPPDFESPVNTFRWAETTTVTYEGWSIGRHRIDWRSLMSGDNREKVPHRVQGEDAHIPDELGEEGEIRAWSDGGLPQVR
jgi:hypothetical protein